MKTALEKLFAQAPQLRPVVTCSATAAGTSFTIALAHSDPDQLLGGRTIEVVTQEAETSSSAITTVGRSGFTSGTFDIRVFGLYERSSYLFKNNLVTAEP
jgi:hypothetical protein